MPIRRMITLQLTLALFAVLAISGANSAQAGESDAQKYDLMAAQDVGQIFRVDVTIEAQGKLNTLVDEKRETLDMRVDGHLLYDEKRLATGTQPVHGPRSIRYYDAATAKIQIGSTSAKNELPDDRQVVIAACNDSGQTLYSPAGPLTRENLDLISAPASSLLLCGLLPVDQVAVGDDWEIPADLLAAVLGIDAVGASDVRAKLIEVTEQSAKFEMGGVVAGAIGGVSTEMEVKAKFRLNRHLRFIDWFAMVIRETRDIGHASPGVEAVAKVVVSRARRDSSDQLAAVSEMEQTLLEQSPELALLRYRNPLGRIEFLYDRRWQILGEESDRLAMRYIERGELMAQCNVAVLPKVVAGKRLSLEEFQQQIRDALGDSFGQIIHAREGADEQDRAVYRVLVRGQANELAIEWIYHLVADPNGNQVVFVLTAEEGMAEHLSEAGQRLASAVRFVEPDIKAAAAPKPAAK